MAMIKGFDTVRKKGICTLRRRGEHVLLTVSREALEAAGWTQIAKADVGVNARERAIAVVRSKYGYYEGKLTADWEVVLAVDELGEALDVEEGKTYEFEPSVQGKAAGSRAIVLAHMPRAGAELKARKDGAA